MSERRVEKPSETQAAQAPPSTREEADREWADHYSRSRNPMEGSFGGLAHMVMKRPGVVVFLVLCVFLLMLLTFLNPN